VSEHGDNANKEFVCSYEFDGSNWSVTVWASTFEEAEMKLKAMGRGTVEGRLVEKILAGPTCPTCGRAVDD
jgi:hypothetical protein